MTVLERTQAASYVGAEPYTKSEPAPAPWFLDPREVLRVLRLRWRFVLASVLLFLAATLAWVVVAPPKYAAVTQILIDPRDLQVVKDAVAPQNQANEASLVLIDSEARVLTSDGVLKRVVEKLGLDKDPEFVEPQSIFDALRSHLSALLGLSSETDPKIAALRSLRDRTSARRLERSFVVELGVTTEERQKSARIAQAIAETYLAADNEARAQATRAASGALAGRLGELQEAVRKAETTVQNYRAANNIVGTRAQLVSEQELTQLNEQLGAARARVAERRAHLDQMERLAKGSIDLNAVNDVLQSTTIAQLRGQLAQVEALLADSASNLGPRHPTVRTNEVMARSLRSQIEAEVKRIIVAARNDYNSALANETALAAKLNTLKSEALTLSKNFVRLRELEREVEANRAVYESFLVRTRELQEQQRFDTSTSRIISPASPPARRSGPPTLLLLAAALAAGLGVGATGSLVLEQVKGRVGSRRRLEQVTGLAAFAALPWIQPSRDVAGGGLRRPELAYTMALSRVCNRLRRSGGARPIAVVVTSADDAEGKSTLAARLAALLAQDSDRVLLIDADPEATATRMIGLRAVANFADLIEGRVRLSDAVMKTSHKFSFLPFPEQTIQPSFEPMTKTLFETGGVFDYIIVNAGLLGVDLTAERLVLDQRFSTVLFTASAMHSRFPAVEHALEALGQDPRLRLVLTDADSAD